jgi:hypothetical protein
VSRFPGGRAVYAHHARKDQALRLLAALRQPAPDQQLI